MKHLSDLLPWTRRPRRAVATERAVDWRPGVPGLSGALSRRAVLGGFARGAAVTIALPPLVAMFDAGGTAYACDGVLPKRFGLWFWGNGMLPDLWTPETTGSGDAWALSEQLAPLAAVKHKLCLVTGLSCKVDNTIPHGSGMAAILTAAAQIETGSDETVAAPSIDQVIADQIGGYSIYKSIQTTATSSSGQSWNGPNSRNTAEQDPYAFYERLFGDTFIEPGEDGEVDPRLGLRRSVLDAVMDDIARLDARLGSEDRVRLEQHLDGVRELEQRLAILEENPPNLEACTKPDALTADYADIDGRPQITERNAIMMQLTAMALACDQTRVFGHYLTDPVSDVLFAGATAGHHDLTHNEGEPQPQVNAITVAIMERLADSIAILDSIPEGDGTLLDNCAVLCTSEVSLAQTHNIDEMPTIIAGSACGFFKQDQHYRSLSGENATKLLISLQRAMDINVSSFGIDSAQADEGLTDIEA
ncbi:MAG: DUF1552 domain-containing protein [Alphaproteobacteria bacterium]|nr:DUF1552 domain-containing protein [Alphaproteobacteria bacterium]